MEKLTPLEKSLKKEIKALKRQLKKRDQIFVEGNKGANCLHIKKLDDNRIHLKVGDCCIYTIDCEITAEAFTSFITNLLVQSNKPFLDLVSDNIIWQEPYKSEVMKGCKQL
jgi:serine/threonine protein phosphatase PrpC